MFKIDKREVKQEVEKLGLESPFSAELRKNVILTVLFTIKVRLQLISVFINVTYAFIARPDAKTCLLLEHHCPSVVCIEPVHVVNAEYYLFVSSNCCGRRRVIATYSHL